MALEARGPGVDPELPAHGSSPGAIALREDPGIAPVLAEAGPDDHEGAGVLGSHRGSDLVGRDVGVDPELRAHGPCNAESACVDAALIAVLTLALPRDNGKDIGSAHRGCV